MRILLFIFLMALSLPIIMTMPRYDLEVGKGEKEAGGPPRKVGSVPYDQTWTEHDCLSHSLYWEAKGKAEGSLGMVLVGLVILHRVESKKRYFPNSICAVVKQPKVFSYFWDGKSDIPKEKDRFKLAQTIATELLIGKYNGLIGKDVLYYKRCDTFSKFFEKLRFVKRHVSHCYYIYEE